MYIAIKFLSYSTIKLLSTTIFLNYLVFVNLFISIVRGFGVWKICLFVSETKLDYLADEPSYEGNTTVRDGDPFKITCRVSMFQVIKWQKDGHTLVTGEHYNISEAVTNENMFVSTITANSASSMHSGAYRCTTQYNKFHVLNVVTGTCRLWWAFKINVHVPGPVRLASFLARI